MPDAGQSWTVLELLRWTTGHFGERGIETARLDAECLLAAALGLDRLGLYVEFEKPVSPDERARFRDLVRRRASDRVPVSQLLGRKEFWSLSFKVTSEVLTPRPDTEVLVEAALERLPEREAEYSILDIGTGSGAIALALASERPKARVTATDISKAALQIARENAEELRLNDGVRFLEGSLFSPVETERFDLVISNPPYVAGASRGQLAPELSHEPDAALFGGEDGFEVLRPLVAGVAAHLAPGGVFLVEVDSAQAAEVQRLCESSGLGATEVLRDLAHRQRAVAARK